MANADLVTWQLEYDDIQGQVKWERRNFTPAIGYYVFVQMR